MPLTLPGIVNDENTFERKLMYKGLAYLLCSEDPGERLEIATLYKAYRDGLSISGHNFKISSLQDFSRSASSTIQWLEKIGKKETSWFKERANQFLPALAKDSKLTFGENEIDALMRSDDDAIQAFIECKSGAATSTGKQTSSYMQASTELAETNNNPVWFVHCHDRDASVSSGYIWSCLDAINQNTKTHLGDDAKTFLYGIAHIFEQTGNTDNKIEALVTWYNSVHNTRLKHDSEFSRVNSMNTILNQYFSVQIHSIQVDRVNRSTIKQWLSKLFPETGDWYNPSKPKSFWMQVYQEGLCQA